MTNTPKSYTGRIPLSEEEVLGHVCSYGDHGWATVIEHTRDPRPQNHYWDRWGVPMLDPEDPDAILTEIRACRNAYPDRHIRIIACESSRGQARIRHTLTIQQPSNG